MHIDRFQRFVLLVSSAALCAAVVGCFNPVVPGTEKTETGKKAPVTAQHPVKQQHAPVAQQVANQQRPANPAQQFPPANRAVVNRPPVNVAATRPTPAGSQSIQLSAGAALPQSLPQGTVMTFSAEYRFVGGPKSGVQYKWVVRGRSGKTIRLPLRNLKSQGQLPALFTPALRPSDSPFRSFIEEWPASSGRNQPGDGKRVSNIITLS
jgi:hypothetical protein